MSNKITKNNNLNKNFIWSTIVILTYALTSLVCMIVATRVNGINDAWIFQIGISFAWLIQVVGFYAGRTYQATKRNKNISDHDFLQFESFNIATLLISSILFMLICEYAVYKSIIMLLQVLCKALDTYTEAIYGIFQKIIDFTNVECQCF